jgi:hypothetical protein
MDEATHAGFLTYAPWLCQTLSLALFLAFRGSQTSGLYKEGVKSAAKSGMPTAVPET